MPDEGDLIARSARDHWDAIWGKADPDQVSWFEPRPEVSLRLIEESGVASRDAIIDVGGGASLLTRQLVDAGYEDLTVLDISSRGLAAGRDRVGSAARDIEWIQADLLRFEPAREWDLWHDRAVFHFLTEAADREAYRGALRRTLAADGHVILATFGPQGPTRCSGLDVRRYSADMLADELGPEFRLAASCREVHTTPGGVVQQFLYARFRMVG